MRGYELVVELGSNGQFCNRVLVSAKLGHQANTPTVMGKVKQGRKVLDLSRLVPGIREPGVWIAELVKERVHHRIDSPEALGGSVLEESCDEINGVCVRLPKHLVEGVRLDLGELVLHVVRVHSSNLLAGGCAQHLDNLNQLIYS